MTDLFLRFCKFESACAFPTFVIEWHIIIITIINFSVIPVLYNYLLFSFLASFLSSFISSFFFCHFLRFYRVGRHGQWKIRNVTENGIEWWQNGSHKIGHIRWNWEATDIVAFSRTLRYIRLGRKRKAVKGKKYTPLFEFKNWKSKWLKKITLNFLTFSATKRK